MARRTGKVRSLSSSCVSLLISGCQETVLGRVWLGTRQQSQRGLRLTGWASAWLTATPALQAPSQELNQTLGMSCGDGCEGPSRGTPPAFCPLIAPLLGCPAFARPVSHLGTGLSLLNQAPSLAPTGLCSSPCPLLTGCKLGLVMNFSKPGFPP